MTLSPIPFPVNRLIWHLTAVLFSRNKPVTPSNLFEAYSNDIRRIFERVPKEYRRKYGFTLMNIPAFPPDYYSLTKMIKVFFHCYRTKTFHAMPEKNMSDCVMKQPYRCGCLIFNHEMAFCRKKERLPQFWGSLLK